jgi:hypothetical protein
MSRSDGQTCRQLIGSESTWPHLPVITEMRILCVAAKQGPNAVFCMPNGTKYILLIPVMGAFKRQRLGDMMWLCRWWGRWFLAHITCAAPPGCDAIFCGRADARPRYMPDAPAVPCNTAAQVVDALMLSRATFAKIRQNLWWAFGYNLVGVPIAAGALLPSLGLALTPSIAGALMGCSSLAVRF